MAKGKARRALLRSSALMGVLCLGLARGAAFAQSATYTFDIPAEPLAAALHDYARVSGEQIIFTDSLVAGKTVTPLHGSYTTDEALERLLTGTGLVVDRSSPNGIMVRPKNAQAASDDGAANAAETTETVVVTGTHIRGVQSPTPVLAIDRHAIDQSGFATTQQLIQSLPQNFGGGITTVGSGLENAGQNSGNNLTGGAGINLRGLGTDATLVLINGQRVTGSDFGDYVDISMIPLDALDRVEVLTDGASAIYGSDAVGGVVNFILRQDFDGVQTTARFGSVTSGFYDDYQAGQLLGRQWSTGGVMLDYQFDQNTALPARDRSFASLLKPPTDLLSPSAKQSLFGSFHQELGTGVELSGDAYWDQKSLNENSTDLVPEFVQENILDQQYHATTALTVDLGGSWQSDFSATYSRSRSTAGDYINGKFSTNLISMNSLYGVNEKVDGDIFDLPGGTVKAAAGVDYRHEQYDSTGKFSPIPSAQNRDVTSVFGELFIPLVGQANAIPGIDRLEINYAERFDDYSDFGSTSNPKVGLVWGPISGFNIRGSYGTSFRAPLLSELDAATNARVLPLPVRAPSGAGTEDAILVVGHNPALLPETATEWEVGGDITNDLLPNAKASITYFNDDFRGRIATPIVGSLTGSLPNASSYPGFISLNPTAAQIAALYSSPYFVNSLHIPAGAIKAIIDDRLANVSTTEVSGIDFQLTYTIPSTLGEFTLGSSGTYLQQFVTKSSSTATAINSVNTIFNPLHFRSRSSMSWERDGFDVAAFLNYQNSYSDSVSTPSIPISSWTTIDLSASYDTTDRVSGVAHNMTFSVAVQNLFDKNPPYVPNASSVNNYVNFDPANASPLGRFFSIQIRKQW